MFCVVGVNVGEEGSSVYVGVWVGGRVVVDVDVDRVVVGVGGSSGLVLVLVLAFQIHYSVLINMFYE